MKSQDTEWRVNSAYTVCPLSPFGVLKNCGAQTNWASQMRFAADHSETVEVFFCRQQMA
jgi:hypothetical protein